jgi:predicted AlkP superfamily phosphohydrolase/phosphomutase
MAATLLIGLDGATYTVLDYFMANGVMPHLAELAAGGARASLRSVIPALTPPAWTSLMTGKRPGQHGVFDFFQKDSPDSEYLRFATSQDVGAPTIWSIASEQQRKVIALNFPLMFPPPAVNGYVVPGGWMPWRQLRLGCYPPGLFDRLKLLPSFNARELALDMAMEEKTLEGCAPDEYAEWIELHIRREKRWFDILRFLLSEGPVDLAAVLFDGVDKLQHLCWRFIDPALRSSVTSPWEQEIAGRCERYFRQLDGMLHDLVDLVGPEATVIVASDHGFGPTSSVLYLNTWLEQQGYLAWAESSPVPSSDNPQLGMAQIARHVNQLDWGRTRAYAATPSSNGIHVVRQRPGMEGGVAPEDYDQFRRALADEIRRIRHPQTGEPIVAEVWLREEVFSGPFSANAPDLTLVLADGGLISILRSDDPVKQRPWPVGTHRPQGIFVARGPAIPSGARVSELSILDVAPTILYSMGLSVPSDMSGRVPEEIFDPDELRRRPVERVVSQAPAAPSHAKPSSVVFDADAEATMMKRLRALGYVE